MPTLESTAGFRIVRRELVHVLADPERSESRLKVFLVAWINELFVHDADERKAAVHRANRAETITIATDMVRCFCERN